MSWRAKIRREAMENSMREGGDPLQHMVQHEDGEKEGRYGRKTKNSNDLLTSHENWKGVAVAKLYVQSSEVTRNRMVPCTCCIKSTADNLANEMPGTGGSRCESHEQKK